jgi:hypothetical protein
MVHIPDDVIFKDLVDMLKAAMVRVQMANDEGNPILSAWLPDATDLMNLIEKQKAGGDLKEACGLLANWTKIAEKQDLGVKQTNEFLEKMSYK